MLVRVGDRFNEHFKFWTIVALAKSVKYILKQQQRSSHYHHHVTVSKQIIASDFRFMRGVKGLNVASVKTLVFLPLEHLHMLWYLLALV